MLLDEDETQLLGRGRRRGFKVARPAEMDDGARKIGEGVAGPGAGAFGADRGRT